MKKILILIVTIVVLIFVSQNISISFCDYPILYKVGTVDTQFNLSNDKFLSDVKKAADIWNKAYGKDIFSYDPNGKLSINLIYDERQLINSNIINQEGQVNKTQSALDSQVSQYKKDVIAFKMKLTDLNNQIDFWNQKGGAPQDVYDQLIQRQKDLQAEADRLNSIAKNLNLKTESLNAQIGKLNQSVVTFNRVIEQRPEEGIYFGDTNRIEIYYYVTQNELVRTIAHEIGHARGLEHTADPSSIMYPKTNQTIIPTKEDLSELNSVCAKKSIYNILFSELKTVIEAIKFN
ncbi:MAG TPA: matrixin family metalloprotease [Clostridia bacterium]